MSYDLTGFRLQPGETTREAMDRLADFADIAPMRGVEWDRSVALADQIEALLSGQQVDRADDATHGWIELTTDRYQVALYGHEVAVSIPYWDAGESMNWDEVDAILSLMRSAGYTIYDSQADEVVEPGASLGDDYADSHAVVAPALAAHMTNLQQTGQGDAHQPSPKRGWWARILGA